MSIKFILSCFPLLFSFIVNGQELQGKLTVQSNRVSTQVDKKIFQTLQTGLTNFLNNRKWTKDEYQATEKIKGNLLISIDQDLDKNVLKGSFVVQTAQPG